MLIGLNEVFRLSSIGLPPTADGDGVRIVGQELQGVLLIAWDGPNQNSSQIVTCIYLYDPSEPTAKVIYEHSTSIDVVGATINRERSILLYTIRNREDLRYDSYQVELGSPVRVQCFNKPTVQLQWWQFLYSNDPSRNCHCIFIVHKESIQLFKFPIALVQGRWVLEKKAIPFGQVYVRKHFWFSWNLQKQRLHYLYLSSNSKTSGREILMMKALQFTERGMYDIVWDICFPVALPSVCTADTSEYIPQMQCLHSAPDADLNIEVVYIGEHSICICVQFRSTTLAGVPELCFSIYPIHQLCRLSFQIPLSGVDETTARSLRIFFSSAFGHVVAYVPGHLFQLVDCALQRFPKPSIQLLGYDTPQLMSASEAAATEMAYHQQHSKDEQAQSEQHPTPPLPHLQSQTRAQQRFGIPQSTSTAQVMHHSSSNSLFSEHSVSRRVTYFETSSYMFNDRSPQSSVATPPTPGLYGNYDNATGLLVTRDQSLEGYAMYDENTGIAYKCSLSLAAIAELGMNSPNAIRAVHVFTRHAQDVTSARQSAKHLLTESPELVTSDLLMEFLLSMTYMHLASQPNSESAFLRLIPSTTVPNYSEIENYELGGSDGCTFVSLNILGVEGIGIKTNFDTAHIGSFYTLRQRVHQSMTIAALSRANGSKVYRRPVFDGTARTLQAESGYGEVIRVVTPHERRAVEVVAVNSQQAAKMSIAPLSRNTASSDGSNSNSNNGGAGNNNNNNNSPFVRRLFSRLLGTGNSDNAAIPGSPALSPNKTGLIAKSANPNATTNTNYGAETIDFFAIERQQLHDAMTEYFATLSAKELKPKASRWVKEYFASATALTEQILNAIWLSRGFSDNEDVLSLPDEDAGKRGSNGFVGDESTFLSAASRSDMRNLTMAQSDESSPVSLNSSIRRSSTLKIANTRARDNKLVLFSLLEKFYGAMEALGFPIPALFHTRFAFLAFECLPRATFLEYVERGIVHLSGHALLSIFRVLDRSPETDGGRFRFALASHSPAPLAYAALQSVAQQPLVQEYVAEHICAEIVAGGDTDVSGTDKDRFFIQFYEEESDSSNADGFGPPENSAFTLVQTDSPLSYEQSTAVMEKRGSGFMPLDAYIHFITRKNKLDEKAAYVRKHFTGMQALAKDSSC